MDLFKVVKEFIFSTISVCGGILMGVWVDENTHNDKLLGPAFIAGSVTTRTIIGLVDDTLTKEKEE